MMSRRPYEYVGEEQGECNLPKETAESNWKVYEKAKASAPLISVPGRETISARIMELVNLCPALPSAEFACDTDYASGELRAAVPTGLYGSYATTVLFNIIDLRLNAAAGTDPWTCIGFQCIKGYMQKPQANDIECPTKKGIGGKMFPQCDTPTCCDPIPPEVSCHISGISIMETEPGALAMRLDFHECHSKDGYEKASLLIGLKKAVRSDPRYFSNGTASDANVRNFFKKVCPNKDWLPPPPPKTNASGSGTMEAGWTSTGGSETGVASSVGTGTASSSGTGIGSQGLHELPIPPAITAAPIPAPTPEALPVLTPEPLAVTTPAATPEPLPVATPAATPEPTPAATLPIASASGSGGDDRGWLKFTGAESRLLSETDINNVIRRTDPVRRLQGGYVERKIEPWDLRLGDVWEPKSISIPRDPCFIKTVDLQFVHATPGCFKNFIMATAQATDGKNLAFIPVEETEYNDLLHVARSIKKNTTGYKKRGEGKGPCDPIKPGVPSTIIADRMCVQMTPCNDEAVYPRSSEFHCDNHCGSCAFYNEMKLVITTTPGVIEHCKDCFWADLIILCTVAVALSCCVQCCGSILKPKIGNDEKHEGQVENMEHVMYLRPFPETSDGGVEDKPEQNALEIKYKKRGFICAAILLLIWALLVFFFVWILFDGAFNEAMGFPSICPCHVVPEKIIWVILIWLTTFFTLCWFKQKRTWTFKSNTQNDMDVGIAYR